MSIEFPSCKIKFLIDVVKFLKFPLGLMLLILFLVLIFLTIFYFIPVVLNLLFFSCFNFIPSGIVCVCVL